MSARALLVLPYTDSLSFCLRMPVDPSGKALQLVMSDCGMLML
jgi:hypothetical protein